MLDYKKSFIVISSDVSEQIEKIKSKISHEAIAYYRDEFLVENSKEILTLSYVSSSKQKSIIFGALVFNTFAQNALLKIIEEPPVGVNFIVVAPQKSILLPTIRSRLPIYQFKKKKSIEPFPLALKTLDLKSIFEFTKENSYISKERARELIESLLFEVGSAKIELKKRDLELFSKAPKMLYLNQKPQSIFITLLLTVLERKREQSSLKRRLSS